MSNAQTAIGANVNAPSDTAGTPGLCSICGHTGAADFLIAPDRFHWRREVYTLKRCASCSYVWLDNPPKPQEMAPHYDEDYHKTIAAGGEGFADVRWRRPREIVAQYSLDGAILDVGCSSGAFLSTLKGGAWKLYGIEMEASTAERARTASGAEVFVGDAERAPFAPESFDVITCFDVLEHVYRPRPFLEKVLSWLKPGGIFLTQLPNIGSWEARAFGTYWYGLELPRHLSHFSPESLRHITKDVGLHEVRITTPPVSYVERSLGFVASRVIERLGGSPIPQSRVESRSTSSRLVRKAMRVLFFKPLSQMAAIAGSGPSIEGIFRKKNGGQEQRAGDGHSA